MKYYIYVLNIAIRQRMAEHNEMNSSDGDDYYEDYEGHLGKCKKFINNVAVAKSTKILKAPNKVNSAVKQKTQVTPKINMEPNKHFKPIKNEEPKLPGKIEQVVDDWEDLM